jgi:hypothetical protein
MYIYIVVDVDVSSNAGKVSSNTGIVDVDPPALLEDSTGRSTTYSEITLVS